MKEYTEYRELSMTVTPSKILEQVKMQGFSSDFPRKGSDYLLGSAWAHCERVLPNCTHSLTRIFFFFLDGVSALVENTDLLSGFQPYSAAA